MTIEIDKAFEIANLMKVVANQKSLLKEEFEQASLYFYNGSVFVANQELISFLYAIKSIVKTNTYIIIDSNGLPVEIADLEKFLDDVVSCHAQATNSYLAAYQKIKNNKSINSILDL